jgi:crotonobetainyl-CoA:carnitine CoA-transferase CaiB-like acyl-CoA transferase
LTEIAADPDAKANAVLHDDPRPDRDGVTAGRHAHFSATMRTDALVSPRLGQHTREVFAEIGYSPADIETLLQTGASFAHGD